MKFKIMSLKDNYDIHNCLIDNEINRYLNIPKIKTIEDTNKYIESLLNTTDIYPYVIRDNNNFVGAFILKKDNYQENGFEFTIYLSKNYWSKGIFNEILPYFENIVFNELNIPNFRGYVMEPNIASRRVLEKNNYILENTFQIDLYPYSIYTYLKRKVENCD